MDEGETVPTILNNRFLLKKFINRCGIATAEFRLARNHRELVVAHQALGFPGVLKMQYAAPDEPGPWIVRDFADVPPILKVTAGRPIIWEHFVACDRALSIAATRSGDGTVVVEAGTADTDQDRVFARARDDAKTIGERLGIVGAYRVNFFQLADRLMVDDIRLMPFFESGAPA